MRGDYLWIQEISRIPGKTRKLEDVQKNVLSQSGTNMQLGSG
jgi:hypothetical protein